MTRDKTESLETLKEMLRKRCLHVRYRRGRYVWQLKEGHETVLQGACDDPRDLYRCVVAAWEADSL